MCEKCKVRKKYSKLGLFCLICLSHIQVERDKIIGRPCTPFPKKER